MTLAGLVTRYNLCFFFTHTTYQSSFVYFINSVGLGFHYWAGSGFDPAHTVISQTQQLGVPCLFYGGAIRSTAPEATGHARRRRDWRRCAGETPRLREGSEGEAVPHEAAERTARDAQISPFSESNVNQIRNSTGAARRGRASRARLATSECRTTSNNPTATATKKQDRKQNGFE